MAKSDRPINEADFLELFYPVHYKIGMALEDALRARKLTRKQVAILWLIRSEGINGRSIPRKDIHRLLGSWFEISNPTCTKSLRAMSRPPRNFVQVVALPHSRRDKQVILTPEGERFVATMVEYGKSFMRPLVRALSDAEARQGYDFLCNISATHDRIFRKDATGSTKPRPRGQRANNRRRFNPSRPNASTDR